MSPRAQIAADDDRRLRLVRQAASRFLPHRLALVCRRRLVVDAALLKKQRFTSLIFRARGVDMEYNSMEGCFQFGWNAKSPRVKLSSLRVSDGEETYVGSGSTSVDGEVVLDLAGVPNPVKLTLR